MKQSFTLVSAFLFSLGLSAQSPLLSSEMLAVGNTVNMRVVQHFDLLDTTIQGANATWDFTALSVDLGQPAISMTIVDPANTPHASDFPTANYAWRENETNYYRYFHLTADKMERVGSYTTGLSLYSDPQIEYVFPFALGSTSMDTWETANDYGTYHLQCVGRGTLMLPGVTFDDVLMVRVHATGSFYALDFYFWYSAENGAILVQYVVGDGFVIGTSGLFAQGIVAGIGELANTAGATVNNPVSHELVLSIAEPQGVLDYSIVSITGALLRTGHIAAGSSGEHMPVDDLAPGMYVLRLQGQQGTIAAQALRFLKE